MPIKVIYGIVEEDGSIAEGSGFQVNRVSQGVSSYRANLNGNFVFNLQLL